MSPAKKILSSIKNRFLSLSWKKKTVVIIVLCVALFITLSSLQPKKPQFETTKVTRGTVSNIISESGNVEAAAQFDVYSPTTGFIEEVYVENGDQVTENQLLFKVKSTATEKEKADASANLLQAQSTLGSANATMYSLQSAKDGAWDTYYSIATNSTYQNSDGSPNNSNRALPVFSTAQNDWLAAEAQFKNQQTVVNSAKAALSSASLAYNATQNATVKSPATGTIANLNARIGEKVTAKDATSTKNKPELIVGDFTRNLITIDLNEVDVNSVTPGQTVNLVFDSQRNKTYKGVVVSVASVGDNAAGVITYNARIAISDSDSKIKPGMTVTVSINTEEHKDVLTVPNNAIKPYKGAKAVLIPGKGTEKINGKTLPFHYVPVKTGIKGITRTEIVNGVTEGETVVTSTGTLLKTSP